MFTLIIVILLVVVAIVFAWLGIRIVQQSETMVIERLGKYSSTLRAGINFILPFFDKPRKYEWRYIKTDTAGKTIIRRETMTKIDLRENVYDFPKQNVITRDNVVIQIDALLYFQITDPVKALYEIANLPDAIEKLTQTTLRNVIGEMDLDHTLTSRDTINNKLTAILDDAANKWGVKVNRVELQDIQPPPDIRVAMEMQMRAERNRRASILEAEGQKQASILTSEGEKQSKINRAEGEQKALVLKASGEAEARIKIQEAEATAIARITEAVAASGGDPTSYLIAVRYIEALKEMVSGKDNKVIYLPYEATALPSTIGGIRDMFDVSKKGPIRIPPLPSTKSPENDSPPPTDEIKFVCPKCNQHLTADPLDVGKTVACPSCGRDIIVRYS